MVGGMGQLRTIAAALLGFFLVPAALADDAGTPHQLGGANGWDAWGFTDKTGKVCYLVGHPSKSEPANLTRGRVDAVVTHRPGEKAFNVVNFDLGYPAKPGSSAELDIDGKKIALFTDKDAAWSADAETDKLAAETLGKGHRAILKASSARGTATTDTYTLDGFKTALDAIDKTCGVKR
jgi:hypothetical protein